MINRLGVAAILLLLFACSKHPQIEKIDTLIQQGKLQQAKQLINSELKREYSDTLQYRRLQYRLIKIQKLQIFKPIDSLITAQKLAQALRGLERLDSLLKKDWRKKSKYFWFDYFSRMATIYRAQGNDSLWFKMVQKAVNHFTDNYEQKQKLYEEAAFYLAQKGKVDQGRKMMDFALREVDLTGLNESLKQAYYLYLNGKFKESLNQLRQVSDSQKDEHWQRLEQFLTKYADSLSVEERFKLW